MMSANLPQSTGNVNVPCTNNGVENCGLMQSYNGIAFNPNSPQESIIEMIIDGTQGTAYGPGLVQWFNDEDYVGYQTSGNPYAVSRGYNSGSIDSSNLSDPLGATASYVSDIANRVQVSDFLFPDTEMCVY
jgi:glucan 1,3-beta-glucosidase